MRNNKLGCNANESRVLAYSTPYRCSANDFHPRQPRVLPTAVRSVAAHSQFCRCFSAEKLHHYLCNIAGYLCACKNGKTRKKQEDTIEERRYFSLSRFVWLGLRDGAWQRVLAAAFCSSSLINAHNHSNSSRPKCEELSPLTTNISLPWTPYLVSVVLCCVFSLQYSLLFRCRFRAFVVATYQSPLISALTHWPLIVHSHHIVEAYNRIKLSSLLDLWLSRRREGWCWVTECIVYLCVTFFLLFFFLFILFSFLLIYEATPRTHTSQRSLQHRRYAYACARVPCISRVHDLLLVDQVTYWAICGLAHKSPMFLIVSRRRRNSYHWSSSMEYHDTR